MMTKCEKSTKEGAIIPLWNFKGLSTENTAFNLGFEIKEKEFIKGILGNETNWKHEFPF
jgi:hypothetical protein